MIIVDDVYKRYQTNHGIGKWVLKGASFTIPANVNVGLVGRNGAGKSTLLRIIAGVDQPSRGRVERKCSVSWPLGLAGGLHKSLTGRQNAKFVCRIYGQEERMPELLSYMQDFAEIGDAFDEPVQTYSSGMQARLRFAMSLALDFDVYITDELTAVGDAAFKKKAKEAFYALSQRAGLIMVSHQDDTLKEFCSAGIWLNEGKAIWFDDISDAIAAYEGTQNDGLKSGEDSTVKPSVAEQHELIEIERLIEAGRSGSPATVGTDEIKRISKLAKKLGIELKSERQLVKFGLRIKPEEEPVLLRMGKNNKDNKIMIYDVNTQCEKSDS